MNSKTSSNTDPKQDKNAGVLEKMAQLIDPPGREISDDELTDPGANIPDAKPDTERPAQKTLRTR